MDILYALNWVSEQTLWKKNKQTIDKHKRLHSTLLFSPSLHILNQIKSYCIVSNESKMTCCFYHPCTFGPWNKCKATDK